MASVVKLQGHETIEIESRRAQTGRFYHWNRTYLIRKDGEIYSIVLNIFHRIAKVFVDFFKGNYFSRFFKVEVLNHHDIQAIVSQSQTSQQSSESLSEEGAKKRAEIRTRERIPPDANSGPRMCGSGQTLNNLVDLRYSDPDIALVTKENSSGLLEAARKCNDARSKMGTAGNCHMWTWKQENGRFYRKGSGEELTEKELVEKYSVMLFLSRVGSSGRQLDFSFDGVFPEFWEVLHERALEDRAFEFASVFVEEGGECEFKATPAFTEMKDIGYEKFVIADPNNLPLVLSHMRFQVKI